LQLKVILWAAGITHEVQGMTWSPLGTSVTGKVGPKGQVVIPKEFRDRLGLKAGGTVFIDIRDDGVIEIEFAWNDIAESFRYFAKFPVLPEMEGKTSLDILHEMDAEDEAILERKYGPWSPPSSSSTPSPSSGRSGKRRSSPSSSGSSRTPSAAGSGSG
jgi:AbrB family looped-hinge helix DNA binding protein